MDIKFLSEKRGGLPIWAWAAISAVILYLGYRFFRSRQTSSGNTASSGAGANSNNLGYPDYAGDSAGAGSITFPFTPGGDLLSWFPPPDSTPVTDNPPPVTSPDTSTPAPSPMPNSSSVIPPPHVPMIPTDYPTTAIVDNPTDAFGNPILSYEGGSGTSGRTKLVIGSGGVDLSGIVPVASTIFTPGKIIESGKIQKSLPGQMVAQ